MPIRLYDDDFCNGGLDGAISPSDLGYTATHGGLDGVVTREVEGLGDR